MKICPNCKTNFNDDAEFCNECGAKLEAAPAEAPVEAPVAEEAPAETPVASASTSPIANLSADTKKYIGIGAAAVVVIVLLLCLFGGNSYKSAVKKYYSAVQKGDAKVMMESMIPAKMCKEIYEEEDDTGLSYNAYLKGQSNVYAKTIKAIKKEQGAYKVSYEIKKQKDIDDFKKSDKQEYGFEDLEDIQDRLEDYFDDYGFDGGKVKKAYAVEVKYDVKGGKKNICKGEDKAIVYKYGSNWYVFSLSGFSMDTVIRGLRNSDKFEDSYDAYIDAQDEFEDTWE